MEYKDFQKIDLPDVPGVYLFKKGKELVYIGKATSLRDRVKSYFMQDLMETRGPKLIKMLEEATDVKWQETDSVLEALILESNLIKKYQPLYNSDAKDDRSYNYVVITKEEYPRIMTIRERILEKNPTELVSSSYKLKAIYGPFPHGAQLREALRIIRKIFPFRGKESLVKNYEEFYRQISLAPDLSSAEAKEKYKKTVRNIELLFQGKKKTILRHLEKEMRALAKAERFEEAQELKRQMFALEHIRDVSLIKSEAEELKDRGSNVRIEAYDIAHTRGKDPYGVMVVVENGAADRSHYRMFKIQSEKKGSDTDALKEILERRLGHPEWAYPKFIVVDGSTAQKRAAEGVLEKYGYSIPVVAVTKDERHRPKILRGTSALTQKYEREILLANSEAHRFAIKAHRRKLRKSLAPNKKQAK